MNFSYNFFLLLIFFRLNQIKKSLSSLCKRRKAVLTWYHSNLFLQKRNTLYQIQAYSRYPVTITVDIRFHLFTEVFQRITPRRVRFYSAACSHQPQTLLKHSKTYYSSSQCCKSYSININLLGILAQCFLLVNIFVQCFFIYAFPMLLQGGK